MPMFTVFLSGGKVTLRPIEESHDDVQHCHGSLELTDDELRIWHNGYGEVLMGRAFSVAFAEASRDMEWADPLAQWLDECSAVDSLPDTDMFTLFMPPLTALIEKFRQAGLAGGERLRRYLSAE